MNSDRLSHQERAYTLVELVAVIVLTAVLAASAAPMIGSVGRSRTSAALEALRTDIAYARSHAMANGRRTWAIINQHQSSWQLLTEPPGSAGIDDAQHITAAATGRQAGSADAATKLDGVIIQTADFDGEQRVGFDRLGTPFVTDNQPLATPGTVRIQHAGAVRVEPITGHVHIID